MKAKITFKSLLVISSLLLTFNLQAITINMETAGTLPTLIDESQKYEITELTLTGDLNGTDIRYIREMAGIIRDGGDGYEWFYDDIYETCLLYIPKGSYEAYKTATGWKEFTNIIEEDDETSIHPISKEHISIYSIPNGIAVRTEGTAPVSVYNISGQQIYQSTIDRNTEINLNKGIYIVRANKESKKVIVK